MNNQENKTTRLLLALGFAWACSACGDDDAPNPDAGVLIDGGVLPAADCVQDPKTHLEIINACTGPEVVKVTKNPVLPKLLPDGSLPPLP